PRNFSPSPNPEGSQAALLKRSMAKVVLGVLTSATRAVVLPSPETAVFTDGAPWPLLPPPAREIPRPALAKMAFRRTALPPPTSTGTPWLPLKAPVLPAPAAVPPTALFAPDTYTP